MESKFVIFVVLVTLAQSCFAAETNLYGLSKNQLAVFKKILLKQEAVITAKYDSINPIFDQLYKSVAALISGQTAKSRDTTLTCGESSSTRGKDAIADSLQGFLLATGKTCSAVRTAEHEADVQADNVAASSHKAIKLAASGNYIKNRAELENLQARTQLYAEKLGNSVFDVYHTCLGATSDDTFATIETARSRSNDGLNYAMIAIFNAVKVYAVAVSDNSADASVLSAIEYARTDALRGFRQDVEYKFSLLKAIFLKNQLDLDISVSVWYCIQLTQTVLSYNFEAGTATVFDTVIGYLKNLALGLSYAGHLEFSSIDVARANTTANFQDNLHVLIDSIAGIASYASTPDNADAFVYLIEFTNGMCVAFYRAVAMTQENITSSPDVRENIDDMKTKVFAEIPNFVSKLFEVISNNKTFSNDVESEIKRIQNRQIARFRRYTDEIFGVADILAGAEFAAEGVNEGDFSAVRTAESAAFAAIDTFTHELARLIIIVSSS